MDSGAKSTMHRPGVVYIQNQGEELLVVLMCTTVLHETMAFRAECCVSHMYTSAASER